MSSWYVMYIKKDNIIIILRPNEENFSEKYFI